MGEKEILEWREHLIKMFGIYHSDKARHTDCPLCGVNLEKISDYMIQELDRVREEGRKELLDSIIEGIKRLKDLVLMFNPMSPEIRAKQSGEIGAYNGLLEKLSKLNKKK